MTGMVKPQSVRAQLARLRAAESFNSSPQLVSFLDYVVEETLAGREKGIKGYTIAVEALGRPQDFDPQSDPIVRVEARRLRQALRSYYAGAGADDEIVIAMPTGGYVPTFSAAEPGAHGPAADDEADHEPPGGDDARDDAPRAAAAPDPAAIPEAAVNTPFATPPPPRPIGRGLAVWAGVAALLLALVGGMLIRETMLHATDAASGVADGAAAATALLPAIRVQVFEATGGGDQSKTMALHIAERFAAALSLFDEIRVIGPAAPPAADDDAYLMRGRLSKQPGGGYALTVAILAPQDREVLLARDYPSFQPEEAQPAVSGATPQDEVVRSLSIEIAQPLGFIGADQMRRLATTGNPDRRCLYIAQAYWRGPTPEKHAQARACLHGGGAAFIPHFLVEAHLSFLALDEYRNDYGAQPGGSPPLDRALAHARAAIEAAPSSARAQQAMMDALFTRGQTDEALRAGARAMTLNPLDMDTLADYGARLVQAGRVREGRAKLLEAAEAMPVRPPWHDFYLVLSALLLDDPTAAIAHAKALVYESDPLSLIAQILAARAQGATDRQEAYGRKLAALDARYRTEPRALLARRVFTPPILDFLTEAVAESVRGDRSDSRAQPPARAG